MTELIKLAGGLTTHSNKNILYFRRGRPGQSAFFMPDSTVELQAGDIIIADSLFRSSAPKPPARPASYVERTAVNRNGPPKEPLVHVALVGLIDRPVVVPLRRESANFPMMFSLLRQDQNPARAVTVLVPRQQPVRFTSEDQEPLQLATGTIVLFDEGSVLRDTLPPLPEVIQPDVAGSRSSAPPPAARVAPGPKILHGMPSANAPQTSAPPAMNAPESPAENPQTLAAPQMDAGKTAPSEEEAPAQKPAEEPSAGVDNSGIPGPQFGFAPPASRTTTAGGKLNSAKPSIRTVSNSKTPDAGNGPNLARVVAPPAFSAPATESAREASASSTAEDSEEETAEEETETESAKAAPMMTLNAGTGMMMFLGGMCVLCCAGMGWMFRDLRRLKSAATTTPETAVQTDSPIRQILYNELPLVEEGGVLGGTLGLAPVLEHLPLHLVHALDHRRLVGVRAGQLDAVAVGVEEVDRVEGAMVGDAQYAHAVGLEVGLELEQLGAVLHAEGDVLHPLRRVGILAHRRRVRNLEEREDVARARIDAAGAEILALELAPDHRTRPDAPGPNLPRDRLSQGSTSFGGQCLSVEDPPRPTQADEPSQYAKREGRTPGGFVKRGFLDGRQPQRQADALIKADHQR